MVSDMTTALDATLFYSPTTGHDHTDWHEAVECLDCYPYRVGCVVYPTIESAAQIAGAELKVVVR